VLDGLPEPVGRDAEPDPMLGQFLLDAVEGVVLVDAVDPLEPDVAVPLVLVEGAPVLVVVAASATSAPPAIRPLVSAPTATTLRTRSFMVALPSG
jgi:hypothetical protein